MNLLPISQFNLICYVWIALALCTFVALFFIKQPYGRHTREGFGMMIDNKLSWIIMEIVSPLVFNYFFLSGSLTPQWTQWLLFGLYNLHYLNRSIIFPLRTKTKGKKIPVSITLAAIFFNCVNGFVNGYFLGNYALTNTHVILVVLGVSLFVIGFFINNKADQILISLRKDGDTGYKIPQGFLYTQITCPNYFGEILEWLGFFLISFNIASLSFLIWTMANLIPRARNHHQWYHDKFTDYPKMRKIIFPYLY